MSGYTTESGLVPSVRQDRQYGQVHHEATRPPIDSAGRGARDDARRLHGRLPNLHRPALNRGGHFDHLDYLNYHHHNHAARRDHHHRT